MQETVEIGWREVVGLPDLGIDELRAKIDTGARTSALHALDLEPFKRDGESWIRFRVPQAGNPDPPTSAARIVDHRNIRNTSGIVELRYVIATNLVLGSRRWSIEVSLADREAMEFDLILGRTAIRRRRLLVNPGRSFLVGLPKRRSKVRRTAGRKSRKTPRAKVLRGSHR